LDSEYFCRNSEQLKQIGTLFRKDLLLEWRLQHTFYGILLYIASTIFILFISINKPEGQIWNGLFWITLLFMSVHAVAKSFFQENPERMGYYKSLVSARTFLLAKLLYNIILMLFLSILTFFLFCFFLGAPFLHFGNFIWLTVAGGFSLTLLFTLLAAIASKASQNAALMAILGFPLIIPQLLLLLKMSKAAFGEVFQEGAFFNMSMVLIGLDGMIFTLSLILFPFLWKD
jgi:heme exporter protein B